LASLGLIDWLSQGRFLENLRALGGGGSGMESVLQAPERLLQAFRFSQGFVLLLPLLAAVLLLRARRLGWVVWGWYFLTALLFTLLVYTSRGTADNHLLELEAAGVLLLARIVSTESAGLEQILQPVLAVAALAALLLGLQPHLGTWRAGEEQGVITRPQVD